MSTQELEAAQALLKFSSGVYYFVEKILGHRLVSSDGVTRPEVLVKWLNTTRTTWEPVDGPDGIGDIDAVKDYIQRLKIRMTTMVL